MLFEAPGVNNSMYFTRQTDRINRTRLMALKHYYEQGAIKGNVSKLVLSDDLFKTDPQVAYALAWGMTFYFSEKQPDEYREFLRNDGRRSDFSRYSSKQRADVFASAFGSDLAGLESRMERFFDGLNVAARK